MRKPNISPRLKKILKIIYQIMIVLTILAFWVLILESFSMDYEEYDTDLSDDSLGFYQEENPNCNVLGIELYGELIPYNVSSQEELWEEDVSAQDQAVANQIIEIIENAEKDEQFKAIILDINSYGGSPTAGQEIANTLKRSSKPVVAIIHDLGLSAAYYAGTGADIIFASQYSEVGSISMTMSYLDYAKQNQKEGINYNQLSTGKFKDMFSPDKVLTAEERALTERNLKIMHQNFVKEVAENRNLEIEKVRNIADGSTMLGEIALKNGLIDKIGGMYEAKQYLGELIGEDVEMCW